MPRKKTSSSINPLARPVAWLLGHARIIILILMLVLTVQMVRMSYRQSVILSLLQLHHELILRMGMDIYGPQQQDQ